MFFTPYGNPSDISDKNWILIVTKELVGGCLLDIQLGVTNMVVTSISQRFASYQLLIVSNRPAQF